MDSERQKHQAFFFTPKDRHRVKFSSHLEELSNLRVTHMSNFIISITDTMNLALIFLINKASANASNNFNELDALQNKYMWIQRCIIDSPYLFFFRLCRLLTYDIDVSRYLNSFQRWKNHTCDYIALHSRHTFFFWTIIHVILNYPCSRQIQICQLLFIWFQLKIRN